MGNNTKKAKQRDTQVDLELFDDLQNDVAFFLEWDSHIIRQMIY